jgi:preprotein translocase subunit SecE
MANRKEKKNNKKHESFLKGVKKEIKLLKWPSKKEVVKYTISTLIFCIIIAIFFVILTYLLSMVVGA